MASLPLPPRKQIRNFTFSQSANRIHKHSTIREFILYCVPSGEFKQKIEDLWLKARSQGYFGNGAQNYSIPHITLVSFFKVSRKNYFIIDFSIFANRQLFYF